MAVPISTITAVKICRYYRSMQHSSGDESYASKRHIRPLQSQTEGADSKTRCQTWRDTSRSLCTPPRSSVTCSSSPAFGMLTVLILRPLSHIPMSVSGYGELGYGKSAKVSPRKSNFQAIRKNVSPTKETCYTVHGSIGWHMAAIILVVILSSERERESILIMIMIQSKATCSITGV